MYDKIVNDADALLSLRDLWWVMVYHGLSHHGDTGKPVGNNPHLCTHTCEGMVCTGVGVVLTEKTHGNTMIYPNRNASLAMQYVDLPR
jgi:hypothetical protein